MAISRQCLLIHWGQPFLLVLMNDALSDVFADDLTSVGDTNDSWDQFYSRCEGL